MEIPNPKVGTVPRKIFNKILAPDVFDYGDSKSESWHRAKKIREVFLAYKSPRALFSVLKIVFVLAGDFKQ